MATLPRTPTEEALRLLLLHAGDHDKSYRWIEWAQRLFQADGRRFVSLRDVEQALAVLERAAEAAPTLKSGGVLDQYRSDIDHYRELIAKRDEPVEARDARAARIIEELCVSLDSQIDITNMERASKEHAEASLRLLRQAIDEAAPTEEKQMPDMNDPVTDAEVDAHLAETAKQPDDAALRERIRELYRQKQAIEAAPTAETERTSPYELMARRVMEFGCSCGDLFDSLEAHELHREMVHGEDVIDYPNRPTPPRTEAKE